MLRDLHIRNLAVLEEVSIRFGPGLDILTGSTGAGKSIVVDSLALLGGARASTELIRTGADHLTVTGVFELEEGEWRGQLAEYGVSADEDQLVIRREISREGRNRVFVNDQPVTLRLLADVSRSLIRLHAQREELAIADPGQQLIWLDQSAGDDGADARRDVADSFEAYRQFAERLDRLTGDDRLRLERLDLLRFQAGEIDSARVTDGEELELRQERETLRNSESIRDALGSAYSGLFDDEGSAVDRLAQAQRHLDRVTAWAPDATAWTKELKELAVRLEEMTNDIRGRLEAVSSDPQRLDELEDRLALLERLFRKYGETSAEVLERRDAIGRELDELEGDEDNRSELAAAVAAALERYATAADKLSKDREKWSGALADGVHRELADLAMEKAHFGIRLNRVRRSDSPLELDGIPVEFGAAGFDSVVFELAANPGEEAKPLANVASGGELSRVYLALQLAVRAGRREVPATLVFDEVDAGIGGAEAAALGGKLQRLSEDCQILAVTHLPQVASFGDRHYRLAKQVREERTHVDVELLPPDQRVNEVARMLAGEQITDASRSHAEELIAAAGRAQP